MEFIKMRQNGHTYYIKIFYSQPTSANYGFAYHCDVIRFDENKQRGHYCRDVTLSWHSTMQICYEFNAAGWDELFSYYREDFVNEQVWEEIQDIRIGWYAE